jgi:hypothetical protein
MYAVLVSVTIDAGKEDEAERALNEQLLPMLKSAPGFVGGYWLEPDANKGWSIVVFDTEENARAMAPPVGSRPPGDVPVVIDRVEFRRVIAST